MLLDFKKVLLKNRHVVTALGFFSFFILGPLGLWISYQAFI